MPTFEFNNQLLPQNIIDIEDIGHCALECYNDEGMFYYIVIRTLLGITTIATCGPVVPDVNLLPNNFQTSLKRMDYKEDKIDKEIKIFLNDKKKITNAKEIPIDEALSCFRDLKEYLKNYNEENY